MDNSAKEAIAAYLEDGLRFKGEARVNAEQIRIILSFLRPKKWKDIYIGTIRRGVSCRQRKDGSMYYEAMGGDKALYRGHSEIEAVRAREKFESDQS